MLVRLYEMGEVWSLLDDNPYELVAIPELWTEIEMPDGRAYQVVMVCQKIAVDEPASVHVLLKFLQQREVNK